MLSLLQEKTTSGFQRANMWQQIKDAREMVKDLEADEEEAGEPAK